MRKFGVVFCVTTMFLMLAGCGDDKNPMEGQSRAEQEKAFQGDRSKIPDNVQQMMKNPPQNARPATPPVQQ